MLIRCGLAVAAILLLGLLWLANARQVSQLVDTVATVYVATLSPSPFGWNGTSFQFGPPLGNLTEPLVGRLPGIDPGFRSLGLTDLTGPAPLYASAAQIAVNAEGMLVLSSAGRSFVLGTREGVVPRPDGADMAGFVAEPGDRVSLVIERSLLAWPTPFEIDVVGLGGTVTTWKRHVYYRLSWLKASGARLSMLWIGEQPYDPVNLWRRLGALLTRVEIR